MKARNLYILITIVITSWPLMSCSSKQAAVNPVARVSPEAINQALVSSEVLFKQRDDLDKLRAAVKSLDSVRDPNQRNYQVEWTFAKYSYFLGKFSTNEEESSEVLEDGRDAGKIASRMEPQKPDG